jgi:hypothetical protein
VPGVQAKWVSQSRRRWEFEVGAPEFVRQWEFEVGVPEFVRQGSNGANRTRVPGDQRVMGDEENSLNLSLSDQQAVERILVQIG